MFPSRDWIKGHGISKASITLSSSKTSTVTLLIGAFVPPALVPLIKLIIISTISVVLMEVGGNHIIVIIKSI